MRSNKVCALMDAINEDTGLSNEEKLGEMNEILFRAAELVTLIRIKLRAEGEAGGVLP